MKYIVGIDIGGTKCAVILGAMEENENKPIPPDNLKVVDRIAFPTEVAKGQERIIQTIFENMDLILQRNNLKIKDIVTVGISCGGPLDSRRGIIMSPPNLPGWDNIPIVERVHNRYGIPARLQNDANACALAEWKYGAGQGFDNIIFLTFGTGMGAGLILNGRLYTGANDMAGEIGHIRMEDFGPVGYGKTGSFEGFCSGGGIASLARIKATEVFQMGGTVSFCENKNDIDKITAQAVSAAALAGDRLAKEIYSISGYYLGKGLAILIDLFNPQRIIIGSIFNFSRNLLWPAAMEAIERESLLLSRNVCTIVSAKLEAAIGDYGALVAGVYR